MEKFDQQKIVEILLYILRSTGGSDIYHLLKTLFFAEKEHLAKWGCKIISDEFYALPYGPVPTKTYDAIKANSNTGFSQLLWENISRADEDANNILLASRDANMDYISASEKETVDNAIKECKNASFEELMQRSHTEAWQKAFNSNRKRISEIDMARDAGASDDMIEYIKEELAWV